MTIIIPAYNSEKTLPLVLKSILNVDYDKKLIRVVIVDSASEDKTFEIAEDFKRRFSHVLHSIEVIKLQERVTTSKARNEGVKRVISHSCTLFLDSDVVLKTSTINDLLNTLKRYEKAGAVGALYLTPHPSPFEKVMWFRYLGKISEGPAGTGALLVKSEVFEKVGFFNENLGYPNTVYEDLEYVMRMRKAGYKVLIDGRNPLLHFKLVEEYKIPRRNRLLFSIPYVAKHFASYLSLTKAYALNCALRVAPLKYKIEYSAYASLILLTIILSIVNVKLLLLILGILISASSFWSLIVYRNKLNLISRVLGGPAVLASRLLRSLSLIAYLLITIVQR